MQWTQLPGGSNLTGWPQLPGPGPLVCICLLPDGDFAEAPKAAVLRGLSH